MIKSMLINECAARIGDIPSGSWLRARREPFGNSPDVRVDSASGAAWECHPTRRSRLSGSCLRGSPACRHSSWAISAQLGPTILRSAAWQAVQLFFAASVGAPARRRAGSWPQRSWPVALWLCAGIRAALRTHAAILLARDCHASRGRTRAGRKSPWPLRAVLHAGRRRPRPAWHGRPARCLATAHAPRSCRCDSAGAAAPRECCGPTA